MLVISGGFKSTRNCKNLIFMCVILLCVLLKWAVIIYCASEAGGEARPADQETREAGPGGRQPGPEWRQRLAQVPPHEGDNRMSSTYFLSNMCQPAEHSFNQYCSSALVRSASCDLTLHPPTFVRLSSVWLVFFFSESCMLNDRLHHLG